MRYFILAFVLFISTFSVSFGQAHDKTDSVQVAAQKEADQWQKTLKLDDEQKKKVYEVCLTNIYRTNQIIKDGGQPYGPSSEKDDQFHNILTEDQFKEYLKIQRKSMQNPPIRKKAKTPTKK